MSDCKDTVLIEYPTEQPCEQTSTDCTIYESAIAYLSLSANSTVTEVIQALLLSLMDARGRLSTIEDTKLTPGYIVAELPTGTLGQIAHVTDATAITYRAIATGGGTDNALVFFDGTNWIYH